MLTPIIIAKIGLAGYGVWTLLFSICAYVGVFNASASVAYSKLTAEYDQRRDYRALSAIISSGVLLIGTLAFLVLGGIWLAREPIFALINVPPDMWRDAGWALLILHGVLLMRMTFGSAYQILEGLQRADLAFKLRILASALDFAVTIPLLMLGYGLLGLAIGHFVGQALCTAAAWLLCRRLCPQLRVAPWHITGSAARIMLTLAGKFQALSLFGIGYKNGLYMVISAFGGVSLLAIFDLGNKLLNLAMSFSGAVKAPLIPAFSSLHASGDDARRVRLFVLSSKVVACAAVICFSVLMVFADSALLVWTGQSYPQAAWTIHGLAAGNFMVLMTAVGTSSLRGKGRVRLELSYMLVNAALTAALIVPAYYWAGYEGMVLTISASLVLASLWFVIGFSRQEGIDVAAYLRGVLLAAGAVWAGAVALGLWCRPLLDDLLPALPPRWAALLEIVVWGGLLGALTALAGWYVLFNHDERRYMLRRLLPGRRDALAEPSLS